jgi:cytochrome c-type biogenesis protein CcmH/NrfG
MSYLKIASKMYPYNRDIMLGPAYFILNDGTVSEENFNILKEELANDPNTVDLSVVYMKMAAVLGHANEAIKTYNKLIKLAPLSVKEITDNLNAATSNDGLNK